MRASQPLLRSSRARNLPLPLIPRTALYTRPILLSPSSSLLLHTPHCQPSPSFLRPCAARAFSNTLPKTRGIQPDTSSPNPPNTEPSDPSSGGSISAAQISDAEYHEIADQYLNLLVLALEELSEKSTEGLEAEFAAGVLTLTTPKGTYVINKQPPNKQIWLSSPISGPKRYDWVVSGSGQHEKEDSALDGGDDGSGGQWVYLRDGSKLSELLKKELGVTVTPEGESDVVGG